MSNDDYQRGFTDGWEAAKQSIEKTLNRVADQVPYKFQEGCPVCGIGANGEPLGYACQHPLCPTKVTC